MNLVQFLSSLIYKSASLLYPDLLQDEIEIVRSKEVQFGDYQCNSAMKISKRYGVSPQIWAQKIVEQLQLEPIFEKIEIKGPGFINMALSNEFLIKRLNSFYENRKGSFFFSVTDNERKKIVIDFSSPNIAKEMHVGHLRSTIIGDSIARILESRGHDVLRLNHVGDWGTAFGMLIAHLRSFKEGAAIESMSLQELVKAYKESKARFDEDPIFKERAQKSVVLLQSGDEESLTIWRALCETSRKAFQEIYTLLSVETIERGESFYNTRLLSIVEKYRQKGLVIESNGAQCIFLDGFLNREGELLPLMIQKSDGGFNYDTTDLAALDQRIEDEKADRIIIVTDSGQSTHFQMIFAAAEKAGFLNRAITRVDHVPFGLVLGADGKKFKTRSGDTEKLIDLLQNGIDAATKIVEERHPEWNDIDKRSISHILGLGAIKYADLSSHRMSDYHFSYDKMLRFEGNTAAFIMYSYVRTCGILKRVVRKEDHRLFSFEHPSERQLVMALLQFDEAIMEVEETLLPNRLTEYLYALANNFNAFFRDCRVEGADQEADRAALVYATGAILKKGLELLGIEVPSKM
ncbi:MAG: arginine--tRNA ligase [Chlamydia sp.]